MERLPFCIGAVVLPVLVASVVASSQPAEATFPGGNGRIAFSSAPPGASGAREIFTMQPNGKDVRQLTDNTSFDCCPHWSPDGEKLVFHSGRDGQREIYVMNDDGTGQTRLTNNPAVDVVPEWSPDGERIVFSSTRDTGGLQLYLMDADGGNVSRLTHSSDLDLGGTFSPDGQKIVFHRLKANGFFAVLTIDVDGTDERQITPDELNAAEPDWSPDGRRILMQVNTCSAADCTKFADVAVMDTDGSNLRELTQDIGGYDPSWSPNGKKIAFGQVQPPTQLEPPFVFDILTMTDKGHALKNVTQSPTGEQTVAWGLK